LAGAATSDDGGGHPLASRGGTGPPAEEVGACRPHEPKEGGVAVAAGDARQGGDGGAGKQPYTCLPACRRPPPRPPPSSATSSNRTWSDPGPAPPTTTSVQRPPAA